MAIRALWKGSINFGLVSIPVWLQALEVTQDIPLNMLDKRDNARISYKKVNARTGKEVPWDNIVKGYKYSDDQYVVLSQDDFKKANVKATQTIDIENFLDLSELDFLFFEKPYFLVPAKGAEKAYVLLKETLEKTHKIGIAKVVIRIKQHLAAIIPHKDLLILEILRFPHEIMNAQEVKITVPKSRISSAEIKMAEDLVRSMTVKWNPKNYHDTYYEDVMRLINYKITHKKTKSIPSSDIEKEHSSTNVIDLMPLLKKSLEKKKTSRSKTKRPQRVA